VCKVAINSTDQTGENTAGVDLGICNTAAVSVGDETLLYPGNALNEDAHYFRREEYDTEGENGPSTQAEWARRKKSRRQEHFLHAVSKDIVEQCANRDVGTIAVGHPKNIREDEDWGDMATNACTTGRLKHCSVRSSTRLKNAELTWSGLMSTSWQRRLPAVSAGRKPIQTVSNVGCTSVMRVAWSPMVT